jgi:hypothetical protein
VEAERGGFVVRQMLMRKLEELGQANAREKQELEHKLSKVR